MDRITVSHFSYFTDDRSGSDSENDNFIEYEQDERRGMKQRNRKRKEMNFAEGYGRIGLIGLR